MYDTRSMQPRMAQVGFTHQTMQYTPPHTAFVNKGQPKANTREIRPLPLELAARDTRRHFWASKQAHCVTS